MTISGIIAGGRAGLRQLLPLVVTVLAAFVIASGSRAWNAEEPGVVVSDDCSDLCISVGAGRN